jgi:hypothetical protein
MSTRPNPNNRRVSTIKEDEYNNNLSNCQFFKSLLRIFPYLHTTETKSYHISPKRYTDTHYVKKKIDLVHMLHTERLIQALGVCTEPGIVVYLIYVLFLIISFVLWNT